VNFQTAFTTNAPTIVLTPTNSAAAQIGTAGFFVTSTTGTFVINSGTNAPAASTTYTWFYTVIGR